VTDDVAERTRVIEHWPIRSIDRQLAAGPTIPVDDEHDEHEHDQRCRAKKKAVA
jgi:hypothetical protein